MAALSNGARLGPYEIIDAIGAGGMGEVYRGRDTRLDRVVAIKVLAPGLAADITSRERFEREARAISSLNHPNICVLHDVGRDKPSGSDGAAVDFLVMEFVDGETLSARLARGQSRVARRAARVNDTQPPMTVEEALAIAIQIAAALDCAHRQGIVHRDLKPGNVMLTSGGVKLLDFGLARLSTTSSAPADKGLGHGMVSLADLSMPTVSSPLTVKGTILGTLQYMAPEQLEGKEVDARADIFAFGSILYEMLTGRKAFEGKSQASLIGAILDQNPPPITNYQPVSPPLLDDLVMRCLSKDPDERWQSSRDLKRQLEWLSSRLTDGSALSGAGNPSPRAVANRSRATLMLGLAIVAGALLGGIAVLPLSRAPRSTPRPISKFTITLPEDQVFTRAGRHVIALSPDGRKLVYVANQQLYVRAMDDLKSKVISGTESSDPIEPMFSPDGEWVAFFSTTELRKVPIEGGTPVALAKATNPFGASWQGDRIIFGQAAASAAPRGVFEVPDSGGALTQLVAVDPDDFAQSPQKIAGGRAIVFALRKLSASWDSATIVAQDLTSGRRTTLVEGGTDPHVLPGGQLVFVRDATLFGVAFDEEALAVRGGPVPIARGIRQGVTNSSGAAHWAWSPSGLTAFVPGEGANDVRALIWIDRQGHEERTSAPARTFSALPSSIRISPDGTRVALVVESAPDAANLPAPGVPAGTDVWVLEVGRGTLTRLSSSNAALNPVWTPDGSRVCYRTGADVMCQSADGAGTPQQLVTIDRLLSLRAMTPDGRMLISIVANQSNDIVITTLSPRPETKALVNTPFNEAGPTVSPNGKWLAYYSNETGRNEVYVRPFPDVDSGRWQVSTDGGIEPRWSRNGKELFYSVGGGPSPRLVSAVTIQGGDTFSASKPVVVAKPSPTSAGAWDVAPDGRFLFHVAASERTGGSASEIVVVQHGLDEITARLRPSPPSK